MNKQVSSLTNQQGYPQEVFWTWINESVCQTVVDLAQKAMELIRDSRLEAGWNKRSAGRRGYRNGCYRRRLTTPHGAVKLKVPRCRAGGLDTTAVFERYQRRIKDVEHILRHAYLLGCERMAFWMCRVFVSVPANSAATSWRICDDADLKM